MGIVENGGIKPLSALLERNTVHTRITMNFTLTQDCLFAPND